MRKEFAELLHQEMKTNPAVYVLTADLGFGILDEIKKDYPDRFYNVGAAEQLMVGAAVGLDQAGKIPFCYSITPFLLYRPFEFIRNFLGNELANVKLVGSGRDMDYSHDGFSHWAHDDESVLASVPQVRIHKPESMLDLENKFVRMMNHIGPDYMNLRRKL